MMTALLIASTLLNIVLVVALVLSSSQFHESLLEQVSLTDRVHIRSQVHINSLCDRIMAADWPTYSMEMASREAEEGEVLYPEGGEEVAVVEGGMETRSPDQIRQEQNELRLLREDGLLDEDR